MNIPENDSRAVAITTAIRSGDLERVQELLAGDPLLAAARIVDANGMRRSLLHIATDWPGHFPNGAAVVATLIAAGADPNARAENSPVAPETPLHWAASSNDVAALDALLDGGADLEAPGGVFTGGTAMSDAVIFAQWSAARRLLERGAQTTLSQAAALGLTDRVKELIPFASPGEITGAFWHACRANQRAAAELLLDQGADRHWVGWDNHTPLAAAQHAGASEVVAWLGGV